MSVWLQLTNDKEFMDEFRKRYKEIVGDTPILKKETGMTIIEAIKSGRRYRRPKHIGIGVWFDPQEVNFGISKESILATDWELEEETVTVTKAQIEEALLVGVSYICEHQGQFGLIVSPPKPVCFSNFWKQLGFKD